MISLTSVLSGPPSCGDPDGLCASVLSATDNRWLAAASEWFIAKPLAIAWIILLGFLVRWLANKLITRLVARVVGGGFSRQGAGAERRRQRAETLGSVLRSVASFVIFTIVAMMVLSELGYDIAPLVTSAGLVGVALGFGAQSLVKDFLSGVFMFFEDQCGVGDTVVIGDTTGVVEALTLRVTRIRAEDGTIWYVRNGEILKVGNVTQGGAQETAGEPAPPAHQP